MKIEKITRERLQQMYIVSKISSPKIAEFYHCRPERVRYLLRKYHIPIRTKSEAMKIAVGISVAKNKLRECYLKQKLSSGEIAKKLKCSASLVRKKLKEYNIPARSIQEAKALTKPQYKRRSFNGNLSERAYLIGFRLGDLYVNQTHKNSPTLRIGTNSTKAAQIELVEKLFKPYGHVWKSRPYVLKGKNITTTKKVVHIRCFVNRSFNFLLNKKDIIEPWILKNEKCFAGFLAGYADAESTFCICGTDGVFSIKSQDKNILWQIYERVNELGILCRPPFLARHAGSIDKRGVKSNKDVYSLTIYRKDSLLKLIDYIGPYLKHREKLERMKLVKKNVEKRNIKYNYRPDHRWYQSYNLIKVL